MDSSVLPHNSTWGPSMPASQASAFSDRPRVAAFSVAAGHASCLVEARATGGERGGVRGRQRARSTARHLSHVEPICAVTWGPDRGSPPRTAWALLPERTSMHKRILLFAFAVLLTACSGGGSLNPLAAPQRTLSPRERVVAILDAQSAASAAAQAASEAGAIEGQGMPSCAAGCLPNTATAVRPGEGMRDVVPTSGAFTLTAPTLVPH
ncbi:hypothetical protein BH18ACT12_BH18ACT12_18710 [soil metagenome]